MTYRTVQLSSCVSAQGELVQILGNGEVLIKDGTTIYRGRPVEFEGPRVPRNGRTGGADNSESPRPV